MAFYHRNSSEARKKEILEDLQLPLGSTEKKLLCVVATVSLGISIITMFAYHEIVSYEGVGVDIKINNAVIFGLSETAENLLQEGGRPMRGSSQETGGKRGYAFFFHKGNLGKVSQAKLNIRYKLEFCCNVFWIRLVGGFCLFVCLVFCELSLPLPQPNYFPFFSPHEIVLLL